MTVILILAILFALGFLGYGILLLFSHKWLPKFLTLMWDKPPEPTTALRIGIWKFRLIGIGNIMLAMAFFIMIAAPNINSSILIYMAIIAFVANFVLGIIGINQKRNKKANSEKPPVP